MSKVPAEGTSVAEDEITRRDFMKGLAALAGLAATGTAISYRREIADGVEKIFDPKAAEALQVKKLFEKITQLEENLTKLQHDMHIDAKTALLHPEAIIAQIEAMRTVLKEIIALLTDVKKTGFRVNSGVVYPQLKNIDKNLAQLNSGNFATLASAVRGFFNIEGKVNGVLGKIPGSTKVHIPTVGVLGIKIDAEKSLKIVQHLESLAVDLNKLKVAIDDISDPDIEDFSNNKYVNEKNGESPRAEMRRHYPYIDDADEDLMKGVGSCSGVNWPGVFLERYHFYEIPPDFEATHPYDKWSGEERSDALYPQRLKGFRDFKAAMKAIIYAAYDYGEKGTVTSSPQIKRAQEMLAEAGYLRLKDADGSYGPKSNEAFIAFIEDVKWNFDDAKTQLGLDEKRLGMKPTPKK